MGKYSAAVPEILHAGESVAIGIGTYAGVTEVRQGAGVTTR